MSRPATDTRLVALDIDGTLLNSRHEATGAVRAELVRVGDLGVHVVLCTGRRWRTTMAVLRQLEGVHPVAVAIGGSAIKRADDESTLRRFPMTHEAARDCVGLLRAAGLVPMLIFDRPADDTELYLAHRDLAAGGQTVYVNANEGAYAVYDGDYPAGDERPLEVFAMDVSDRVRPAAPAVCEAMAGRGLVKVMRQPLYGPRQVVVEVHDLGCTKWHALSWLLQRWELRPEQVVAMGDDVNDIPMLRAAGRSFAMGGASDEVKAAATDVTATNDDDGVVRALRRVFPD